MSSCLLTIQWNFNSGGNLIWIAWIMTIIFRITGAFYHLTSPAHPCRVTSPENDTIDLICQYREGFVTSSHRSTEHACVSQRVTWQRVDYHVITNITDTNKYGVWEAVPGWRLAKGMRISLLRIRGLQSEDIGLYRCRIQCVGKDGRLTISHHMANLCLEQEHHDFSICRTNSLNDKCFLSYNNGICDPECDNEEDLYDGFDCAAEVSRCRSEGADSDATCTRRFANGVCDPECDRAPCAWDGGDCIDQPLTFAADVIVLTLARWYVASDKIVDVKALSRTLSLLLRTVVRIMPGDWKGLYGGWPRGRRLAAGEASWHRPDRRGYESVRRIYIKIDNTLCRRRCFTGSLYAAKFLDLALRNGWQPGVPISSVGVLAPTVNRCSLENNTLLHIDLPVSAPKESKPNIYSYTFAENQTDLPPTWLLVIAVVGVLLIIVLVIVITVIIVRIRKLTREERHHAEGDTDRIRDKNAPEGTDV